MLTVSLIFLLAWAVFGFDSVIDNLFYLREGAEGVGLHYSTLHGIVFLFYISILNFHVGGIKSFNHLIREVKKDFNSIIHLFRNRESYINSYGNNELLDARYAFVYSGCLALFVLFAFEFPYVFLLNYFHYDSLFYPIYYFNAYPISPTLIRNVLGFALIPIVLILFQKGIGARLRWDRKARFFILLSVVCFALWIGFPSTQPYKGQGNIDIILDRPILTWPNQEHFPQTIYVYLNTSINEPVHERNDLDGWYQEDNYVHAINVITKYVVFLAVGYIFIIEVKEK